MSEKLQIIDDIRVALGESFCNEYSIDTQKKYVYEWISAKELIVSRRIDLIAKYKYVEAKEKRLATDFYKEIYKAHIGAFSRGTFIERGQESVKNSFEKYINIFDGLIADIKENGVDPRKSIIPVGANGEIMDGAHRVAIAAYYDQKVPIVRFSELHANCGTEYFIEHDLRIDFLDYLVYEYAKFKQNIDVIVLWPKAGTKPEIYDSVVNNITSLHIIYRRKFKVNMHMLRNFMIQVYSGFEWLGAMSNNFSGASKYAEQCYGKGGNIEVFVVEGSTKEERNIIKAQVRKDYGYGNSTIHSTDNFEEALEIMRMLFNKNSRHFLSFSNPIKYKSFNEMILDFKKEISKKNMNEDIILDSGAVLAAYGLRNTYDIDYLAGFDIEIGSDYEFDKHDDSNYECTIYDLIYNPENYFYYWGIKFVCLEKVKKMKESRYSLDKNQKDLDDIRLINTVGKDASLNDLIIELVVPIKRAVHNFEFRIEIMLSTAYIFKPARYIYHKLKGTEFHG